VNCSSLLLSTGQPGSHAWQKVINRPPQRFYLLSVRVSRASVRVSGACLGEPPAGCRNLQLVIWLHTQTAVILSLSELPGTGAGPSTVRTLECRARQCQRGDPPCPLGTLPQWHCLVARLPWQNASNWYGTDGIPALGSTQPGLNQPVVCGPHGILHHTAAATGAALCSACRLPSVILQGLPLPAKKL